MMPAGLPLATTKAWPAMKYGIMSTFVSRLGVIGLSRDDDVALPGRQGGEDLGRGRVQDHEPESEPGGDLAGKVDVGADGLARRVEELLGRVRHVGANGQPPGGDELGSAGIVATINWVGAGVGVGRSARASRPAWAFGVGSAPA